MYLRKVVNARVNLNTSPRPNNTAPKDKKPSNGNPLNEGTGNEEQVTTSSSISKLSNIIPPFKSTNRYYTVFYCDRTLKKHRIYQTGVLVFIYPSTVQLYDESYQSIAKSTQSLNKISFISGEVIITSKHQIELDNEININEFESGRTLIKTCIAATDSNSNDNTVQTADKYNLPKRKSILTINKHNNTINATRTQYRSQQSINKSREPWSRFGAAALMYNPYDTDALILNKARVNLINPVESMECPVVVYPRLATQLRPHQRDGIQFMYNCILGISNGLSYPGCILADEMGLGKTLQILTLVWTLLKSGPLGQPVIQRSIVIAPTTLVNNWYNECMKWIGMERITVCKINTGDTNENSLSKINAFLHGKNQKILLISYENYKKFDTKLNAMTNGLIVCDEGILLLCYIVHPYIIHCTLTRYCVVYICI